MIAQLEGQVTWTGEDALILNVGGVGYLVFASAAILHAPHEKTTLRLWIETLVREDAITLYGFSTQSEQALFRMLLGVQGVGARVAMILLSTFGPETLQNLILSQDKKGLVRAEGVGTKLAERLVLELKDKIAKHIAKGLLRAGGSTTETSGAPSASFSSTSFSASPLIQSGFEALASLGYRPSESLPALESALKQLGDAPSLEHLVREALALLNPYAGRAA